MNAVSTDVWSVDCTTSGSITANVIAYSGSYIPTFSSPKPRTNVDWLRERVDEMRVKLT